MSQRATADTPDAPDGTDPRIVIPTDDEPDVKVKSSFNGTGNAYHTVDCRNVHQMQSTREVKRSIAEWKGYHECEVCITEGEYNDDPSRDECAASDSVHPTPTPGECAIFRERIIAGESPKQVASTTTWGRTTVYSHANGDCTHETPPATPPVTYGWHADPDAPDDGGDARTRIPARLCRVLREQLLKGETRADLAERHDISKSAIASHANGNCNHPPDAHGHPPLTYGWHEVDE